MAPPRVPYLHHITELKFDLSTVDKTVINRVYRGKWQSYEKSKELDCSFIVGLNEDVAYRVYEGLIRFMKDEEFLTPLGMFYKDGEYSWVVAVEEDFTPIKLYFEDAMSGWAGSSKPEWWIFLADTFAHNFGILKSSWLSFMKKYNFTEEVEFGYVACVCDGRMKFFGAQAREEEDRVRVIDIRNFKQLMLEVLGLPFNEPGKESRPKPIPEMELLSPSARKRFKKKIREGKVEVEFFEVELPFDRV